MRQMPKDEKKVGNEEEENLYSENALELSSMTAKERRVYKKELRNKRLEAMDGAEKRRYIIYYYKWYFVGMILAVLLCCWLGKTIYTATLPTELMIAVTNDGQNAICEEYISKAFREYYHLDHKNVIQIFDDLKIENRDNVAIQENMLTDYEKVIVYISSDQLDAIIGNQTALEYYKSTGDIAILDQCMEKELYHQIEQYVVDATDETAYMNSGKPYAAAIDISETEFARKCQFSYDDVYLMIPSNRYDDNGATMRLIRMIFQLEDTES